MLRLISGQEAIKALAKVGFYIRRQRGSHIILRRDSPYAQVSVPNHKTLDRGTLRAIIRDANLTIEDFNNLLN